MQFENLMLYLCCFQACLCPLHSLLIGSCFYFYLFISFCHVVVLIQHSLYYYFMLLLLLLLNSHCFHRVHYTYGSLGLLLVIYYMCHYHY